jgi:serine/threonine protein kinase/formylglycine-generating enzyme required for sulfatase activity
MSSRDKRPTTVASQDDSNLLFGIIALQMDFITRDQLVAAMGAWALDRSLSLGQVLVEQQAIGEARRLLLESLVQEHVRHHGDATRSLASLDPAGDARAALETIEDEGLQDSLGRTRPDPGEVTTPDGTAGGSVGRLTSGGRFRILRLHAKGGLGEVFVARDEEVRRDVAVKQIRREQSDNPQGRARFLLEAEITGSLEHPGIVPVYGLGYHEDGRPYYAMRLIRGDSLKEAIARFHDEWATSRDPARQSLGLRTLLDRFIDVCDAIAYAHSRGVLHRDLKPLNVMLGPFGETLVVDWGLAKVTARSGEPPPSGETTLAPESALGLDATMTGQQIGTPAYMPPEAAEGRLDLVGPQSDVYSLGATLYAILTGRAPFAERDVPSLLRRVRRGDFVPPRKLQPWIDPALEAICLKAMALEPRDRYPSPRGLAEDVNKWMADEPVSAWREPALWRLARWARRHQPLMASATVATIFAVLAASYAVYQSKLQAGQRLTAAKGRVDAMLTAEVATLPGILRQLEPDRGLVRNWLRAIARGDGSGHDRRRLPAALALLPEDPSQGEFLIRRAFNPEAGPDELLVIREALAAQPEEGLKDKLLDLLQERADVLDERHLRAAGMLARIDPTDPIWPGLPVPLARALVRENSLRIGTWRRVFQPVARILIRPLRELYADVSQPDARGRAFNLLVEFANEPGNSNRAEDLAALIDTADPKRMEELLGMLTGSGDAARAVAILSGALSPPAHFDEDRAGRQGRIAIALMRFGQEERVWPLFVQTDEPSLRTELIHDAARFGVAPGLIVGRLVRENDPTVRRALILCLGEYDPAAIEEPGRKELVDWLVARYRQDPDPGVHGAIEWLLRRSWRLGGLVDAADRELATRDPVAGRGWYINGQGEGFAVIRGPVEFAMGSTREIDPESVEAELQHASRIPRSFAISSHELTLGEYGRFLDEKPPGVVDNRGVELLRAFTPGHPAGMVSWYEACRYCNWLSAREGLPPDQWCYPADFGPDSTLPADFVDRTGYRLPTEAEWEFACRAGTISSRPIGHAATWLGKYAWLERQSGTVVNPVGLLKPNDLGLFDMLSNSYEWCISPHTPYAAAPASKPWQDVLPDLKCGVEIYRVLRGGTVLFAPATMRSSWRSSGVHPVSHYNYIGFRLARTCPPATGQRASSKP